MRKIISILIFFYLFNISVLPQAKKENRLKPKWITETLKPTNTSYNFYVSYVEVNGNIEEARRQSKIELCRIVQKEENISIIEEHNTKSEETENNGNINETINRVYNLKVSSEGQIIDLNYIKLDEYWIEHFRGGVRTLGFYTLYAVAKPGIVPQFDDVYFTDKYGAKAMAMSLIPGCGQFYKGSIVKGASILAGEALCVTGIILCESQRASYYKKMKEQPRFAKTYNTKSDNWENGRNICIGAAAALYVYNLIDAVASKGARRAVVRKRNSGMALVPMVDNKNTGLSLVWKF